MQNDLIKRYIPVNGIGTFICCECIIDSSKSFILDEFPEVMQIETHGDQNLEPDFASEMALKCLIALSKKYPPSTSMFFLNGDTLMNSEVPGTIFIGCNYNEMKPEESMAEFVERVRFEIMSLNVMREKDEDDMDDTEKEHHKQMFEVGPLNDISIAFEEKEDEEEKDDLDIGFSNGLNAGIDQNYHVVQVALYKMFKKKKIKDLEFILEEIHNTVCGMMDGEDFKVWEKNFKKWIANNKKKESHLEDDNKESK